MSTTVNEILNDLMTLPKFCPAAQVDAIRDNIRGEEREWFLAKLAELVVTFNLMPKSYQTGGQGDDAIVHLHYFSPAFDWYITERDAGVAQRQAFGLARMQFEEMGYIDIVTLMRSGRVELDFHWAKKTLGECRS